MTSASIPPETPDQLVLPCVWDESLPATVQNPGVPPNFVLIDFENTQPKNLHRLLGLPIKVYVFTGENQAKISLDFAAAMQQLGESSTYVRMTGSGPSALDFHIAFYIGELAASEPDAHYYIVSDDKGFDPLVTHLNHRAGRRISVRRIGALAELPMLSDIPEAPNAKQLARVLSNLWKRQKSLPKTLESLEASIRSFFGCKATESDVTRLLEELQQRNFVVNANGKLTYHLPAPPNGQGQGQASRLVF